MQERNNKDMAEKKEEMGLGTNEEVRREKKET
jgi:hypothetical protein